FLCCQACVSKAQAKPEEMAATAEELRDISTALAKLSDADRKLAEAQRFCPVMSDSRLGSMGKPVKLMIDGKPVFICCEGCRDEALAKPEETLKKLSATPETK